MDAPCCRMPRSAERHGKPWVIGPTKTKAEGILLLHWLLEQQASMSLLVSAFLGATYNIASNKLKEVLQERTLPKRGLRPLSRL